MISIPLSPSLLREFPSPPIFSRRPFLLHNFNTIFRNLLDEDLFSVMTSCFYLVLLLFSILHYHKPPPVFPSFPLKGFLLFAIGREQVVFASFPVFRFFFPCLYFRITPSLVVSFSSSVPLLSLSMRDPTIFQ